MAKESTYVTSNRSCGCGLQDSAYAEEQAEQEAAKETSKDAVTEANKFSNTAIPLPLKITGLAVLVYLITR